MKASLRSAELEGCAVADFGEVMHFDAAVAADALELLADVAPQHASANRLETNEPVVNTAVDLLQTAREWLALQSTPSEEFAGDVILRAVAAGAAIEVDTFIRALLETAKKLLAEAAKKEGGT